MGDAVTHRYYLVAAAVAAPSVRQLFAFQWGISGFQELRAPVCQDNNPGGAVTHYSSSFACNDDERDALIALENDGVFGGGAVYYLRCEAETGTIVATNCPAWASFIGTVVDFDAALGLIGLSRYRPGGL